jgi:hypothetical protein
VLQERGNRLLAVSVAVEGHDGTRFDEIAHCVAFTGKQIIDNMSHNKVCTIQGSDRTSKGSARAVFNSLYKGYRKAMVVGVYELRPTSACAGATAR